MKALIKRNLLLYFRDRATVLFSLLTVFIVIGLYVLFLGDMMINNLTELGIKNAKLLTADWVTAGLLTVVPITTGLGALSTMVNDKNRKIINDFKASPVSNSKIIGSYLFSCWLVSLVMSLLALAISIGYLTYNGSPLPSTLTLLKLLGGLVLTVLTGCSLVFFLACRLSSLSAFNNLSILIGTLLGFLTGIYIPIGQLPTLVQTVIKCFPPSHAAVLFRGILMDPTLSQTFAELPASVLSDFQKSLGLTFYFKDQPLTPLHSVLLLLVSAIIFSGLALVGQRKKAGKAS